jgi:hypothetical protein
MSRQQHPNTFCLFGTEHNSQFRPVLIVCAFSAQKPLDSVAHKAHYLFRTQRNRENE